jgi:hypothetical protein
VYPFSKIRRCPQATFPAGRFRARAGALLCALLSSGSAFAALGGDASSVQSDAAHLVGSVRVTNNASYGVQEIQTPTGTTVREYVSPAGKVFAVAWQGPWPPDLHQLLGSYFTQFQQAAQAPKVHAGHAPISVHRANLVVEHAGHMRSYRGRAYLTDQLPSGVTAESIR